MSREKKYREPVTPRDVLIPLGVGLVLGVIVFAARGGFSAGDAEAFWRAACDALAVPGLLLTCSGLLTFASAQGTFYGLNFSVKKVFSQILSEEKRNAMPRTFYDYVNLKQEKQRNKTNITLYAGLVFLTLAAAALAAWTAVG